MESQEWDVLPRRPGCGLSEGDENVYPPNETTVATAEVACRSIQPGQSVLQIGTGSGFNSIAIARAVPDARERGTDINPRSLEIAKLNAQNIEGFCRRNKRELGQGGRSVLQSTEMNRRIARLSAVLAVAVVSIVARWSLERKVFESCTPGQSCPQLQYVDGPVGTWIAISHSLLLIVGMLWAITSRPTQSERPNSP